MLPLTLITLLLLLTSLVWSFRLYRRERDARLLCLSAMFALLLAYTAVYPAGHPSPTDWRLALPRDWHALANLFTGGVAFLVMAVMDRLFAERTEAHAQLAASESRLRSLFECSHDALLLTDSRGHCVDANPAAEALLGYPKDRLREMSVADLTALSEGERLAPGGRGELILRHPSGETRVGEYTAQRIAPGLHMAAVRDVTARRRADDELRRSRQLVQSTLDALSGHVAIVDDAGKIIAVNRAWWKFAAEHGVSDRSIGPGANYADLWCQPTARGLGGESVAAAIAQVFADGRDRVELIYNEQAPDQQRWFLVNITRFSLDDRVYAVVWHEDISRLKLTEEALRASEAEARKLAAIAALTENATMTLDAQGRVLWANDAFLRVAGLPLGQVTGRRFIEFFREPDQDPGAAAGVLQRLADGDGFRTEVVAASAPRQERWFSLDVRPVRDEHGRPTSFIGVAADITERRRAERALRTVAEGVSAETGEAFFRSLVRSLAQTLGVAHAVVGELIPGPPERIRTLAYFVEDRIVDNIEYELAGTPCENVVRQKLCTFPAGVAEQFPNDTFLAETGIQSYVGAPLTDADGRPIGVLVVLHTSPLANPGGAESVVRIFAARAAAEFQRTRAEAQLRQSEGDYRSLFELAGDAILIFEPDDEIILDVNQRACELYGIPRERFVGTSLLAISETPERGRLHIAAVLANQRVEGIETVHRRADGSRMTLLINATAVHFQGKRAVLTINRDITEAKRAELELRASEELNRGILESVPGGIVKFAKDGSAVQANAEALRFLGLTWDQFASTPLSGFASRTFYEDGSPCPPEEYPAVRCLASGQRQPPVTIGVQRPDGAVAWAVFTAIPLLDPETRRPEGAVVTFLDLTERRRAEQALRDSEERLRRFAESDIIGIVIADIYGNIKSANDEFLRIIGYSRDDLEAGGFRWSDLTPPEHIPLDDRGLAEALATGRCQPYAKEYVRKDGSRVPVLLGFILAGQAREEAVAFVLDLTTTKRTENALRESERRFRAAAECVSDLIFEVDPVSETIAWFGDVDSALGYAPGEFPRQGRGWIEVMHPDDRPRVLAAYEHARSAREVLEVEYRVRCRDGSYRRWSSRSVGLYEDDADEPYRWVGVTSDVTELRHAEESRRRLEAEREQLLERLRLQIDRMPLACILLGLDSSVMEWNPAAERIFGYTKEEILGRRAMDVLVPESSRAYVSELLERIQAGDMAAHGLNQNVTKDGRTIVCEWTNTPLHDEDGRIMALLSMVQDVTSRKLAEDRLRESERRYHTLAEVSPVGIFRSDLKGNRLYHNEQWERMAGMSPERASGHGWIEAIHPDDRDLVLREWERSAAAGEPLRLEHRFRKPDGSIVWVLGQAHPERDDQGRVVGFVGTVTDITERKQLEEDLRRSEDRYRRLVESAPVAILVHQDGRFVYVNERAVKLLGGASAADLVGTSIEDRMDPHLRPVILERLRRLREDGRDAEPMHQQLIRLDGTTVDVEIAGSACVYAGAPAIQIIAADVTERRKFEEELRRTQKMEAIGQLASGVAHDFNNLLTAIFGYTSLAKRTLHENHPANRSLDRVEEAARQASGVTRALLTFAREDSAQKQPIQMEKVVEESVRLLRRTLPGHIELRTRFDPGPIWVNADGTQLQQVVMNLAINARDAMTAGGVLSITVDTAPPLNGDAVPAARLTVADSGAGMPPEVQSRLFEPFFTTKPLGVGTGLGLAIVHSIVKDHAGTVEVRSEPGRGSVFTILIPGVRPGPIAAAATTATLEPVGRGELILIADGHQYVRELVSSMLTTLGYRVVQAPDGETFIEDHRRWAGSAALLIIDADLPRRPGRECIELIRAAGDQTPAILMTGDASESENDGPDPDTYVLAKPFQMTELASTVRQVLSSAPSQGDRQ